MTKVPVLMAARAKALDAKRLAVQGKRRPADVSPPLFAALAVVILALAQMIFPEPQIVTDSSRPIHWMCSPIRATAQKKELPPSELDHDLLPEIPVTVAENAPAGSLHAREAALYEPRDAKVLSFVKPDHDLLIEHGLREAIDELVVTIFVTRQPSDP